MSPVWVAICTLAVGFLGLLVTLVAHLLNHAYKMGQRDQRIADQDKRIIALEGRPHDDSCATQLAAMTATLTGFERTVSDLKQDLHSIRNALMGQQTKTSSRRVTA